MVLPHKMSRLRQRDSSGHSARAKRLTNELTAGVHFPLDMDTAFVAIAVTIVVHLKSKNLDFGLIQRDHRSTVGLSN